MADRLKTSEIKLLLKQCVQDGKNHPIDDFKKYIADNAGKPFSIGQLSGAICQLTALGELENVERGLYRKGPGIAVPTVPVAPTVPTVPAGVTGTAESTIPGNAEIHTKQTKEIDDKREKNEEYEEMWRKLRELLWEGEHNLAEIAGKVNLWGLSSTEYELLGEVKRLGEKMKEIASRC